MYDTVMVDTWRYTFIKIHITTTERINPKSKLWTLVENDVPILASQLQPMYHTNARCKICERGRRPIWEFSVLSTPFFCESKTSLKNGLLIIF